MVEYCLDWGSAQKMRIVVIVSHSHHRTSFGRICFEVILGVFPRLSRRVLWRVLKNTGLSNTIAACQNRLLTG